MIRENWSSADGQGTIYNMAGMKGLVDTSASCGAVNPLMRLTTHFSQDKAKADSIGLGVAAGQTKGKQQDPIIIVMRA